MNSQLEESLIEVESARMDTCRKLQTDETPLFRARAAHGLQHYRGNLEQIIGSNYTLLAHGRVEKDAQVRGAMRSTMIILCGHGVDMSPNEDQVGQLNMQLAEALAFKV
jgi:hypothetical protein